MRRDRARGQLAHRVRDGGDQLVDALAADALVERRAGRRAARQRGGRRGRRPAAPALACREVRRRRDDEVGGQRRGRHLGRESEAANSLNARRNLAGDGGSSVRY